MPRKEAKSKSLASWFIFLVILMLMWAAFDDITTGREPVYTGEYWVVGGGIVSLGGLYYWLRSG